MKRIITVITLVLISQIGYSQGVLGSDIWIKNNAGTRGYVYRIGNHLGMNDSTANVYNLAQKLKLDSLYTKINSSIAVTMAGHDSTTDSRIGVKLLQNPTIAGFASTPTVNIGTGGYAVSASDSNKYRIGIKVLESALPVGGSTAALQTSGNTLLQGIKSHDSEIYLTVLNSDALIGNISNGVDNISTWMDNNTLPLPTQAGENTATGFESFGLVSTSSPTLTSGKLAHQSITPKGGTRVTIVDSFGNIVSLSGGGGGGLSTFTSYDTVGSSTSMTVTNLNSLANSATVGWQSDTVINRTRQATDYRIFVKATMSNTAPANDKQIYLYIAPFYYDGTSYLGPSLGTTSQATGVQGACTIASAAPNNLILLGVLSYSTQNMVLQSTFSLSSIFGKSLPDAWSLVLINYTGSNISASGNNVYFKPVYVTNR